MAHGDLIWRCECGNVIAKIAAGASSRAVCYCNDCQAFVRHFGRETLLSEAGGSDVIQVLPDQVTFVEGEENIALLRLSPKGLFRWYAACCGTPMCNTASTPRLPLASFLVPRLDDPEAAGPVLAHVQRKSARGPVPVDGKGVGPLIAGFAGRALVALGSGRWRITPFFKPDGTPVREPHVLSKDERDRAYAS